MAQKHPDEAVYVAKDKKSGAEVSFNEFGQKLDSGGNVVWGDRQSARAAGAKVYERPQKELHLSDLRPAPAPAPPRLASMAGPVPQTQPARSTWDNSLIPSDYGNGVAPSAPGGYNPYANRGFGPGLPPPSMADITGSTNRLNGAPAPGVSNTAVPSFGPQQGQPWKPQWGPAEDFMAGRNPYSPVQGKIEIPGFGQLPTAPIAQVQQTQSYVPPPGPPRLPFQVDGLNVMPPQGNGMMYDPYGGNYNGNPLSVFRP